MPDKTIKWCVLWLLCLTFHFPLNIHAQYFDLNSHKNKAVIPFRMVRNMVVIQLKINGKGPFNFIMDTGVGLMIITDPKLKDSLNITCNRVLKLRGLGEGESCQALVTPILNIDIPGLVSYNIAGVILKTDDFSLSNYAGVHIHGLLGYDFFNNLAVKVNFSDSTLTAYRPKDIKKFGKGEKIPITIEDEKPYLEANVQLTDGSIKRSKLIVDLGAGHPISLENMATENLLPKKYIIANLGIGFNGPINGYLSRISGIELGKYKIRNLISSFPTNDSPNTYETIKRDGNLGIELLKKFTVVFDYPDSAIYLKPNPNYKTPFEHDMSGLEYYANGDGYRHVIISRVEPGSAGDKVGLEKDDEIVAINFMPISTMSLEQIDDIFKSQDRRNLLIQVYHDKKYDNVILTLKRRI